MDSECIRDVLAREKGRARWFTFKLEALESVVGRMGLVFEVRCDDGELDQDVLFEKRNARHEEHHCTGSCTTPERQRWGPLEYRSRSASVDKRRMTKLISTVSQSRSRSEAEAEAEA